MSGLNRSRLVFKPVLDRVVTQRQLLAEVWGPGYEGDVQTLRVFVGQLRRKLKESIAQPRYILTEPGVGSRLRGEPL